MSFLKYYQNREERRKNGIFTELARPSAKWGEGEKETEVHEIRKVPYFIDWKDIEFLSQFPPQYWNRAFALKHGDFLFEAEEDIAAGREPKEVRDVTFGNVTFKGIKTGIKEFHEKMTKNVDNELFASVGKSDEDKQRVKDSGTGMYGYVIKDPKKIKGLQFAKGYVAPTIGDAAKRLQIARKGVNDGWLVDPGMLQKRGEPTAEHPNGPPPIATNKKVTFGGRTETKTLVYSKEALKARHPEPGRVTADGQLAWSYIGKNGKEKTMYSHLPILFPAKLINTKDSKEYYRLMGHRNQIEQDVEAHQKSPGEGKLKRYEIPPSHIARELTKLSEELTRGKRSKSENKKIEQKIGELERDLDIANKLHDTPGEGLEERLENVKEHFFGKAKKLQASVPKHGLHDWNVHHFNFATRIDPQDPQSPQKFPNFHTGVTGYGTWSPTGQQVKKTTSLLPKEKYKELWDFAQPFVVQAGMHEDEDIPFVHVHKHDLKKVYKPLGKVDIEGETLRKSGYGPLAKGINRYINSSHLFTAAREGMLRNWWDIFQNAAIEFRGLVGDPEWTALDKAREHPDKEERGKEVGKSIHYLKELADKIGFNYASRIYQMSKARRRDERSLSEPMPGTEGTLEDLIPDNAESLAEAGERLQKSPVWVRLFRPEPGDPMTGSTHAIEVLEKMVKAEEGKIEQEIKTVGSAAIDNAASTKEEESLLQNILHVGYMIQIYRSLYIQAMEKANQEWNFPDADAFANQKIDKYLAQRGVKPAPEIKPKAMAQQKINDKKEEAEIETWRKLGYSPQQIQQKLLASGKDDPVVEYARRQIKQLEELQEENPVEFQRSLDRNRATLANKSALKKLAANAGMSLEDAERMFRLIQNHFVVEPKAKAAAIPQIKTTPADVSQLAANVQKFVTFIQSPEGQKQLRTNKELRQRFDTMIQRKVHGWEIIDAELRKLGPKLQAPEGTSPISR